MGPEEIKQLEASIPNIDTALFRITDGLRDYMERNHIDISRLYLLSERELHALLDSYYFEKYSNHMPEVIFKKFQKEYIDEQVDVY